MMICKSIIHVILIVLTFGKLCSSEQEVQQQQRSPSPPHIVIILADDLGWNDVSFHGSDEIFTPNIDALAYNGLILNQHYNPSMCTPSRAALLTAKYPIHTGMQHLVILESEPWGLPLQERLLPEQLAKAGYISHMVGKWHLGFYRKEYTPTYRGFTSHFGYFQGFHDYYNHTTRATYEPYEGYDMRRNLEVDWSANGEYSTDLFTKEAVKLINKHETSKPMFLYLAHLAPHAANQRDPFQAPDESVAKFAHIQDPERRVYAAMVSKLDDSVGEIVAALREKKMLQNSMILFMSDNGAPTHGIHSNRGSNYPLRGMKNSAWEGGNRGVAALWSPLIKKPQRVANQLMYITDWYPTLCSLAEIDVEELGEIDGLNMWPALSEDLPSPRQEILYNIDTIDNPYAALRQGDWKYITGSATGTRNSGWYGVAGRNLNGIHYDTESVLLSKSGVAISGFIIKQQIHAKIRATTGKSSNSSAADNTEAPNLLNHQLMLQLRREADVKCMTPLNNSSSSSSSSMVHQEECNPLEAPCLFNLELDPCEMINLAVKEPEILLSLEKALQRYDETVVKARNVGSETTADPALWNNTWSCWQDELDRLAMIEHDNNLLFNIEYSQLLSYGLILMLLVFSTLVLPTYFQKAKIGPQQLLSKTMSVFTLEGTAGSHTHTR